MIGKMFTVPATLILDAAELGYAREPVLRRMPDGSLFCLFLTGGITEPDNNNLVMAVRSIDDGANWSRPFVVFQHRARAAYATELFTDDGSPRILVQTFNAAARYREMCSFWSISEDNGGSWSEPQSLCGGCAHVNVRQGIVLSDGSWLFPVYWLDVAGRWDWIAVPTSNVIHNHWPARCGVLISRDQGRSFALRGNIGGDNLYLSENNCVELDHGQIVMLLRAEDTGCLYRADSKDGGETWSKPYPTTIPNPGSKFCLLRHGRSILLIHNPCAKGGMDARVDLSIWVSADGMKSWKSKMRLTAPGVAMFYPHAFIDAARETIYIACENTIQHYLLKVPLAGLA